MITENRSIVNKGTFHIFEPTLDFMYDDFGAILTKVFMTTLFLTMSVLPVYAAEEDGLYFPPGKPITYTCDEFRKDLKNNKDKAIEKAVENMVETLDYIADSSMFSAYKDTFRFGKNGLTIVLQGHRESIKENMWIMKMISDEMTKNGPVEYILSMCDLRKGSSIENIASAAHISVQNMKKEIENQKKLP